MQEVLTAIDPLATERYLALQDFGGVCFYVSFPLFPEKCAHFLIFFCSEFNCALLIQQKIGQDARKKSGAASSSARGASGSAPGKQPSLLISDKHP